MKRAILLFLLFIVSLIGPGAEGADWILYGEGNDGSFFYDRQGMRQVQGKVRQVWIKKVLTPEGTRNYKKKYPAVKGAEKISADMLLIEVDCSKKQFRMLKGTSYDSSGHEVTSFDYVKTGAMHWEMIGAESSAAALSEAVCK